MTIVEKLYEKLEGLLETLFVPVYRQMMIR